jgi:CubicO group peptidase (beta-lactamase class C family)
LFDRLKYLYDNLMFAAVGYMIELQSGKPWEQFVRGRILRPLEMNATSYSTADMVKQPEHGVGFTERRDSFDLYRIPYYEDIAGVAPCTGWLH